MTSHQIFGLVRKFQSTKGAPKLWMGWRWDRLIHTRGWTQLTALILRITSIKYKPGCSSFHNRNKCVSLCAWTPYASGCGQREIAHPRSICSMSYTCRACQSGDTGSGTAGWTAGRTPWCSLEQSKVMRTENREIYFPTYLHACTCRACLPCES